MLQKYVLDYGAGHVMFEMSTGRELTHVLPTADDYRSISDCSCRNIIYHIFKRKDGRMKFSLKQVNTAEPLNVDSLKWTLVKAEQLNLL